MPRRARCPPHPSEGLLVAGRFRVERVHHLGGGHAIPVARDRATEAEVAMKLAPAEDAEQARRHATEIACLARVRHPNVARLVAHGVCELTGMRYLALEHVAGLTLHRWLDLHAPIRACELRSMGLGLAAALAEIHRRGIVLGGAIDEPDVVVGWNRGHRRPVITGLARATVDADGADGPRADVRVVGAVLHRMLFGTLPQDEPLALATDRSPALREVVARCLAEDPAAQPATGGVLVRELARALEA